MELYVGLYVSLELTSVCVVDSGGKSLWEGKCSSTREGAALRQAPVVDRTPYFSF
jgi:transposase